LAPQCVANGNSSEWRNLLQPRDLDALLKSQPGVDVKSVRVRFLRLGAFSLDIELVAYTFARDWDRFLEIQEGLLDSHSFPDGAPDGRPRVAAVAE
jgi:hypothetical protein